MGSTKTRILFIESNRDGTVGGSYYSLLYLMAGLNREKYEADVLFCRHNTLMGDFENVAHRVLVHDYGPSVADRARNFGDFIKWPYRFLVDIVLKQYKLHKILQDTKPDIIHLNNGYSIAHEWMLAARLHSKKVVSHDRGTRPPASLRTRLFAPLLDAIICVSESYKQNVIDDRLAPKSLHRVYNGLDVDSWTGTVLPKDVMEVRRALELDEGKPVVGIVGNIDYWKGQHVVLEAIQQVKVRVPDIKCLVVGKVCNGADRYAERLHKYVADNGLSDNIVFTGYQKSVANFIAIFNVLVHASIEPEPFGRVIIEGMALGKPVVASNAGGPRELIEDGVSGTLVAPGDAAALAAAILAYIEDPSRAAIVGKRARERVTQLFSVENMVRGVEQVYEGLS